jgi:hypothetical protein
VSSFLFPEKKTLPPSPHSDLIGRWTVPRSDLDEVTKGTSFEVRWFIRPVAGHFAHLALPTWKRVLRKNAKFAEEFFIDLAYKAVQFCGVVRC